MQRAVLAYQSIISAAVILLAMTALAVTVGACSDKKVVKGQSYTVRGEVTGMPTEHAGAFIRHEAIPEFVDATGERRGMMSMIMEFAPSQGVSMDGITRGDKVEFRFRTAWDKKPALRLESIKKLPPDTKLEF